MNEKLNFVNDVKSFVQAYTKEGLKKKLEKEGGVLRFTLNGEKVELVLN